MKTTRIRRDSGPAYVRDLKLVGWLNSSETYVELGRINPPEGRRHDTLMRLLPRQTAQIADWFAKRVAELRAAGKLPEDGK